MIGKVIPTAELQARWSYAEIDGRFKQYYIVDSDLRQKAADHVPFDELTQNEMSLLTRLNITGYRKDFALILSTIKTFQCESWTKEQLLRVYTLPILDPRRQKRHVPLLSFLTAPRFNEDTDPRVNADKVPLDTPFYQREPLIVGYWNYGVQVLYEGYFRAALFIRSENPNANILVWVPNS
jgi:hypothetical protein